MTDIRLIAGAGNDHLIYLMRFPHIEGVADLCLSHSDLNGECRQYHYI